MAKIFRSAGYVIAFGKKDEFNQIYHKNAFSKSLVDALAGIRWLNANEKRRELDLDEIKGNER